MDAWEDFRASLAEDLAQLPEGASLVLRAPEPAAPRATRRRFWRPEQQPASYVQFLSNPPVLMGECSAPRSRGGSADLTPEQEAAVLALGWREPGEVPEYRSAQEPNYWRDWTDEPRRHDAASELAVATLRGPLAVPSPDGVTVQRS